MLKKAAAGRAAAATGRGDPAAPASRPSPTAKVAEGGACSARPASRLLSTRSVPSLFAESPMTTSPAASAPELLSRAPLRSGGSPGAAGLAGVLVAEEADERGSLLRNGRRVLRGTRLRVQLPPPPPIEFGVKNREAQLALLSPVQRSPARLARRRSEVEEELAGEDYTCVIARGPNPRMTHIFEDRVVESSTSTSSSTSCDGCNKDAALLLVLER
jgi:hypothetical protein